MDTSPSDLTNAGPAVIGAPTGTTLRWCLCYRETDLVSQDLVLVHLQNISDSTADGIFATHNALKPHEGLAILKGNLAPEGCVLKVVGHERIDHRGPARVFESEEDAFRRSRAGRSVPATS